MLRRGFKSLCERKAAEIRKTLGLPPSAPLRAESYAAHLRVTIWRDRDVKGLLESDLHQLTVLDSDSWSALTLRINERYLVIYNSSQSAPRINSVVMHELAHIALGHKLSSVGISEDGHLIPTVYDQDQEDEANWLAGTLLLPRKALLNIRSRAIPDEEAMKSYGVSREMLTWRVRMTGVDYQLASIRKSGNRAGTQASAR